MLVNWGITDNLALAMEGTSSRGGEIRLSYGIGADWELGIGAGFRRERFRLDNKGVALYHVGIGVVALAAAGTAMLLDLAVPTSAASGYAALLAAPFLAARQAFWKPHRTAAHPMLWILHLGHAWIAIGFACHAASILAAAIPASAALHALTAGAMGCMIIGMMARVSLGHTGRPIEATLLTRVAFLCVTAAAIVRVAGPAFPLHALVLFVASGTAFATGYLLFAIEFAPLLWRPRADSVNPPSKHGSKR